MGGACGGGAITGSWAKHTPKENPNQIKMSAIFVEALNKCRFRYFAVEVKGVNGSAGSKYFEVSPP
jgi:hypothetical protein